MPDEKRVIFAIIVATIVTVILAYVSLWWVLTFLTHPLPKIVGTVIVTSGVGFAWYIICKWITEYGR